MLRANRADGPGPPGLAGSGSGTGAPTANAIEKKFAPNTSGSSSAGNSGSSRIWKFFGNLFGAPERLGVDPYGQSSHLTTPKAVERSGDGAG